ncbi:unnamed protein product [Timema podura]|uniref:Uncharacterized protein n=1 Tax=Timema podura TaxID=61482 RepID=A0ABN7PAZ4_TIMPD|nr:unnamed protein product [Timema podura]
MVDRAEDMRLIKVEKFRYLGCLFIDCNNIKEELNERIMAGFRSYYSPKTLLSSRRISSKDEGIQHYCVSGIVVWQLGGYVVIKIRFRELLERFRQLGAGPTNTPLPT